MKAQFQPIFHIRTDGVRDHEGDYESVVVEFLERRIRCSFGDDASFHVESPVSAHVEVTLSTRHPLIDCELLDLMIGRASELRSVVLVEGAVPGTAPVSVRYVGPSMRAAAHVVIDGTQQRYNSQLTINRAKRLKVFKSLLLHRPDLHALTIPELLDFLGTRSGVELVLSYGERVQLERYEGCPNCESAHVYPVHCGAGQPVIGFLTRASEYYFSCGDCGLIFLNPVMGAADVWRLYDWYDRDGVVAPPASSFEPDVLKTTSYFQNFDLCLNTYGSTLGANAVVLDLGGGTGQFALIAKRRFPTWDVRVVDFDCHGTASFLSTQGVRAESANFCRMDFADGTYDLITMWEVVEHLRLEDLKTIWGRVYAALRPGGRLVFSTPDFASAYARAADFWAAFAPQHLTVLSRRVLEPMWTRAGFELERLDAECLTFRADRSYFAYGAAHHDSLGSRGDAAVIQDVLQDPSAQPLHLNWMRNAGVGSEMIVSLVKPRAP